jgi:hypothetical protein
VTSAAAATAHRRRLVTALYAAAAILLLPWSVLLATRLPARHLSAHWDIAWTGFDIALAATLAAVAVSAWRRSPWLEGAASAAAALLLCDAWFDLLTAATGRELALAAVEAALVELPMAVLCLRLARRAERAWLAAAAAGAGFERQHLAAAVPHPEQGAIACAPAGSASRPTC